MPKGEFKFIHKLDSSNTVYYAYPQYFEGKMLYTIAWISPFSWNTGEPVSVAYSKDEVYGHLERGTWEVIKDGNNRTM